MTLGTVVGLFRPVRVGRQAGCGTRNVFASDYPHWDFDDPSQALPQVDVARRQQVFHDNALALYGT
jgi:predicted TIM-barrel fold metal-dependent hydrolase